MSLLRSSSETSSVDSDRPPMDVDRASSSTDLQNPDAPPENLNSMTISHPEASSSSLPLARDGVDDLIGSTSRLARLSSSSDSSTTAWNSDEDSLEVHERRQAKRRRYGRRNSVTRFSLLGRARVQTEAWRMIAAVSAEADQPRAQDREAEARDETPALTRSLSANDIDSAGI